MKLDGKQVANQILTSLRIKVLNENLQPFLATILVGDDNASKIYVNLKKTAIESIGAKMQIFEFSKDTLVSQIKRQIVHLNNDKSVTGIMIQLPIPGKLSEYKNEFINLIGGSKDVDGLKTNSNYTAATVKAVLAVLDIAKSGNFFTDKSQIAVVGFKGEVGKRLLKILKKEHKTISLDIGDDLDNLKKADVVISATGKPSLIKSRHLKTNAVLIDVGAPKPEFDKSCYRKASFYTPVPGGVGPLTVASLVDNLVEAASKQKN